MSRMPGFYATWSPASILTSNDAHLAKEYGLSDRESRSELHRAPLPPPPAPNTKYHGVRSRSPHEYYEQGESEL
jgi:hypothetical protein